MRVEGSDRTLSRDLGSLRLQAMDGVSTALGLEVVGNDADVVHPLNRHVPEHRDRTDGGRIRC